MIIVKIIGGLGNQMFQYAYAKALQEKGNEVKIDISVFNTYKLHGGYQLDKYKIDLKASTIEENNRFYKNTNMIKILRRLGYDKSTIIKEETLLFDDTLLKVEDNNYISGYFQTELYFKDIRESILREFIMTNKYTSYTEKIQKNILSNSKTCSIHIRRGDFINNTNISLHGACDLSYYTEAIKFMNLQYRGLKYFIFSDDISWVRENLEIEDALYIDSAEPRPPHEDIYLMSICSHNIIANSSFSWWGAWLNQNQNKVVIAPKRWFVDDEMDKQAKGIAPDGWIKI